VVPDSRRTSRPEHAACAARPWPSVEKPTVRTDRPGPQTPSALRPWTPRHSGPQRDKVPPRDREKTACIAENSQLAGRFRRWWQVLWQVLGSNQRRLSRRFYSPRAPAAQIHAADQQRCTARRGSTPSAPAPSFGSGELERATGRDMPGHRRPTRSGYATACPFPASHPYGPGRSRPPDEIARPNPIRTIPIGLDQFCDWSRPQGFRYQHGFSTRSGNDGK
jgi:hypothetical protein